MKPHVLNSFHHPWNRPDLNPLQNGDIWVDETNDDVYVWIGDSWVQSVGVDEQIQKYGHTIDDATDEVVYSWNEDVTIKSDKSLRLEANKKGSSKPVIILRDSDESIVANAGSASLQCNNNISVFAEKQLDIVNNTGNLVVSSIGGPIAVEAKKNLVLISDDEDVTLYAPNWC